MLCKKCGAPMPDNSSFCPNCGARFVDTTFDSAVYKSRAKERLRGHYWPAFAASLIVAVLAGGPDAAIRLQSNIAQRASYATHIPSAVLHVLAVTYALMLISLIYNFFVSFPIEVGSAKYFVRLHDGVDNVADVFYSFRGAHYLKIVGGMAWQYLFIFLWSLLLIIPGIVKAYAYCLVPYILAENPHIGYRRAIKLSMQMTNGFKGEIFVLQLSFIGWFLLGIICLGVGVLFVQPYYNATFTEMYLSLRNNALSLGICREEDFR